MKKSKEKIGLTSYMLASFNFSEVLRIIYIERSRFCIGVVKIINYFKPNKKKQWKLSLNNYKKPKYNTLDPLLSVLMCSIIIISG